MSTSIYHLLTLCARAECDPIHRRLLAHEAAKAVDWEEVPTQAESHGLAPLLYTHLKAAEVRPPPAIIRELQGLYLRHRRANRIRLGVLRRILRACESAGIRALVLKGAALSCLVYPEPGLRPMSDIDLLVRKSEVPRVRGLLAELGFQVVSQIITIHTDGLLVNVEVHHDLLEELPHVSLEIDDLTSEPFPFSLEANGPTAHTLGYEEMLWYLCHHMVKHATVFAPHRLIWMADIISFAERFSAEIDWGEVARLFPLALNTLSLLHFTTPLSEVLRNRAHLETGHTPKGLGEDFEGWPRSSLAAQQHKGFWRILRDTFYPSEWWLRLHYGLGNTRPLFWHRWARHPLDILGWGKKLVVERLTPHIPWGAPHNQTKPRQVRRNAHVE